MPLIGQLIIWLNDKAELNNNFGVWEETPSHKLN